MNYEQIVTEIDNEITRLQEARTLLSGSNHRTASNLRTMPPPNSTEVSPKKKRHISLEGRKRIAAAVKKRWAAVKKAKKAEKAA